MRTDIQKRNSSGRGKNGFCLWLRRHRWVVLTMSLVITLVLLGIMARPAYFTITHAHALNCGGPEQLEVARLYPKGDPTAIKAATCFVQAHQHCRAATMFMLSTDPSGGSKQTFYTANNLGSCSLSTEIRVSSVARGTTVRLLDCMSLLRKTDGLHFLNCGDVKDEVFSYAF
ncbi:hypothetical protein [Dictyobacter formicarum]|uniref:hypothetical protein n=1 Tax=Dictyobacter formicarum TaxID=2778368 RepID=UPI001915762F|nr:hypothetical protein [Dictyobacter formicarum]